MDGLLLKEKVLELIRIKGPQLPVQLATQLQINSTFAGAFLSELIADGKIRITSLKVGGSPVYYCPGQEIRLQSYSKYLNQREKEAYDLLGKERIVKDDDLQPVMRVAMRSIKDFAMPLRVTTERESAIFWKWYLLTDQEMHPLLEKKLGIKEPQQEVPQIPPEEKKQVFSPSPVETVLRMPRPAKEAVKQKEPVQVPLPEAPSAPVPIESAQGDPFMQAVQAYFAEKGVTVLSCTIEKKNTSLDCIVQVPTPLGPITYYCTAKKKKRCSDADINAGYIKAAAKHMPYMFLSTGELPKKVKEFVALHLSQIIIRTLDHGNKNL
ncbi:hypothetical protein HY639_05550 [Candidatus Woesearchaeota archaeon]|nr:hypothetical protein [Candidatus Woesearchaeota archaeon]